MYRRLIALFALAALTTAGAPMVASASCSGGTALRAPGTVDQVDDGETDTYVFTVPAGQTAYLQLQPLNGDMDLKVCSGNTTYCEGHNMYPVGDGCHFEETSVPDPVLDPSSPFFSFGNGLTGQRTYRVKVNSCFSSADPENCDYTLGLAPEVGDELPPIQYVLALVIQ